MNTPHFDRRVSEPAKPPRRVNDQMILRCRAEVEHALKRRVRQLLLLVLRLRFRFTEIGEGFQWGMPINLKAGSRIGRYVYIGRGFEAAGTVSIGDLTMVSSDCKIVGADHQYDALGSPTRLAFASGHRTTTIGADVWIGMRVTIKEGVVIGDGAVIGSGAVVTRNVPGFVVVAGVPAKVVRERFAENELREHIRLVHLSE